MRAQKGGKISGETARKIKAKQENEALENQISFPKRNRGKNCECCITNEFRGNSHCHTTLLLVWKCGS